jgi:hypothetical protein
VNVPVEVGEEHTVAGWFKAPLTGYVKWLHMVADNEGGAFITATNNVLGVKAGSSIGCGFDLSTLADGWHHVAAVASGTSTDFYVDGQYAGTAPAKLTTRVVYIGNDRSGNTFSDALDDVRVYDRALTENEIGDLIP